MIEQPDSDGKEMEALLQTLWKQNYGILQERLRLIRNAYDELAAGSLDSQTRSEGEAAAHKLAGILGTFGLPQGSALASKIEVSLSSAESAGKCGAPQLHSWLEELETVVASRS
jgi:HPt (histidine-containing phosphotransfer) domain-containing protein